jgi:hypothetical protein
LSTGRLCCIRSGRVRPAPVVTDRPRHIRATGLPSRERAPGRSAAASRQSPAPSCGGGGRHKRRVRAARGVGFLRLVYPV